MKNTTIFNTSKSKILYQGDHASMTEAVEKAIRMGISLSGANLSGQNLSHANLDGANLSHAWLNDCDLTGTNLSEADLTGAYIQNSDLTLATLCEARLNATNFSNTSFAATLITHTQISGAYFTCPSTFTLPFADAIMGANTYQSHRFTGAPVVITGLPKRIVFLDDVVLINDTVHPRPNLPNPFEELFKKTS